ncbi:MAG: NEW3 domain-containing protein [Thermoanaerobaculia bacterium]
MLLASLVPATVSSQSAPELQLSVESAEIAESEIEADVQLQEKLQEEGLASEVELRRFRSRLARARIETEKAKAALTSALPPVRLLSVTRSQQRSGQPRIRLRFGSNGTAAERFGQSAIISVEHEGLVVGRPFQQLLTFAAGASSPSELEFELIRDVTEVSVVSISGSRRDEIKVPVQRDAGLTAIQLSCLNSSQDGSLGETVNFDVIVERSRSEISEVQLELRGLPTGFSYEILDQSKSSRLRRIQFPQGVDRVPVVARISVPEKDSANWSDKELALVLVAGAPEGDEELADLTLLLRAIGRPELDLLAETLSVKLEAGTGREIPLTVVNSGRAAAQDVRVIVAAPLGLSVEALPVVIRAIEAGQQSAMILKLQLGADAVEGDYEVRVHVVSERTAVYARSKETTIRVMGTRRANGLFAVAVLGGIALASAWTIRRRRRSADSKVV